jgi:hypothetical protein
MGSFGAMPWQPSAARQPFHSEIHGDGVVVTRGNDRLCQRSQAGVSQPPSATTTTKASASKLSVPTSVWIWISVPFGVISKGVSVL